MYLRQNKITYICTSNKTKLHTYDRARQTRVRAYARTRKCKNNGGPYGLVKLEVRGRTWYSTNPRTPFPPISLSCVRRIWL